MSGRRKSLLAVIVVPVVVLMSLLAISVANAARTTPPPSQVARVKTITISMFAYTVPASVKAGSRVKIVNTDQTAHTVTSDTPGVFNIRVPGGRSKVFTAPATAGTYAFHCRYHSTMHGELTVK